MRKPFRTLSAVLTLTGLLGAATVATAGDVLEEGKKLAFETKKGNCLACHVIAGGDQGGNIAPPLVVMKARFPDKAVLRAQIYDARVKVPNTIMIPFGPHGVLSDEEIDKVLEFIYTL